jgi:hypothetical protein
MIYGINLALKSHFSLSLLRRLWLQRPMTKQWTIECRKKKGEKKSWKGWQFLMVCGAHETSKSRDSHEYFHFLWFLVNEIFMHWFSFGPWTLSANERNLHWNAVNQSRVRVHMIRFFPLSFSSLTKDNNRMCETVFFTAPTSFQISFN